MVRDEEKERSLSSFFGVTRGSRQHECDRYFKTRIIIALWDEQARKLTKNIEPITSDVMIENSRNPKFPVAPYFSSIKPVDERIFEARFVVRFD